MARRTFGIPGGLAGVVLWTVTAGHAADHRRNWEINQVSWVKLVPREKGAAPNAHPAALDPAVLKQNLEGIRVATGSGEEALFAKEELAALAGPMTEALAVADPDEDLVLLSSHRRGVGLMSPQLGLTARLFVQAGLLNVIVHDSRLDFVGRYVMNNDRPAFRYGSRTNPGPARLCGEGVRPQRPDWIAIAVLPAAQTPAASAPAAATVPKPIAGASAVDGTPEQRLRTIKRLREENLITEAEYQEKRREILKEL